MSRWEGYFVFVYYCNHSETSPLEKHMMNNTLSKRVQIISKPYIWDDSGELIFPINQLRNIGIQHVQTSHYAVIDMDLWLSSN